MKVLKDFGSLVGINFAVSAFSFYTTIVIANHIGKESFGLYSLAIAIGVYGQVITRVGSDRILIRELAHNISNADIIVTASLLLRLLVFLLGLIVFLALYKGTKYFDYIIVSMLGIILANALKGFELQSVYDSFGKIAVHALLNVSERIIFFVGIWVAILVFPKQFNLMWIGVTLVLSNVVCLILQLYGIKKYIRYSKINISLINELLHLLKQSTWVWCAEIVALSFGTFTQIALANIAGASRLGGYAAAYQITAIVMIFIAQIARVGNPKIALITLPEVNFQSRLNFVVKYSGIMFLCALVICMPIAIFPDKLLSLMFNAEYDTSSLVTRILCIYVVFYSLGAVASQYIISSKLQKSYFTSVILGGFINIVLCYELIPIYADVGAALALCISNSISMLIYFLVMMRHIFRHKNLNIAIP